MLARASLTAPDLGVALKRWCRHHGLLTDDMRWNSPSAGAAPPITLEELRPLPAEVRELSLAFLLRNVHGLACWYVDSRIPLQERALPVRRAAACRRLRAHVPGPLQFARRRPRCASTPQYLKLPLRRDEKALAQMLQRALSITVLQYRRDRLLVPQVRQALAAHPERSAQRRGAGGLLHVSARTLHRQLKDEGASLQQLKDEVRLERAKDLLCAPKKPVKQVAAAVGFRNEKSFARAFRVVLHRLRIAHLRGFGVLPELALGTALAQQVPALVELLGHVLQARVLLLRIATLAQQLVLFVDQGRDVVQDALVGLGAHGVLLQGAFILRRAAGAVSPAA
jgi:AraC-like DNA-binding protein